MQLKVCLDVNITELTEGTVQQHSFVNMVMNFIFYKMRNFLNNNFYMLKEDSVSKLVTKLIILTVR